METVRRGRGAGRRAAPACCGSAASGSPPSCQARKKRASSSPTTSTPRELVKNIPSHRVLALLRGRNEGFLRLARRAAGWRRARRRAARAGAPHRRRVRHREPRPPGRRVAARNRALDVEGQAARRTSSSMPKQRLREQAEAEAIRVFGSNLHDLLLAAPAGQRVTMGLDPGIRTGVKVAVVDGTGRAARDRHDLPARAAQRLGRLAAHARRRSARSTACSSISIGNGTASRETDKLAARPHGAATRSCS